MVRLFLLCLRDRLLRYLARAVFLCYLKSEAFAGEALVLGEISYSLVFDMDIGSLFSKDFSSSEYLISSYSLKNQACVVPSPWRRTYTHTHIYIYNHHHHVAPSARISLILLLRIKYPQVSEVEPHYPGHSIFERSYTFAVNTVSVF